MKACGEHFFVEIAAIVGANGPPDRSRFLEVMSRYGLTVARPGHASHAHGA
jgi:hypothetical protein